MKESIMETESPHKSPKSLLDTAPVALCVIGEAIDRFPVLYANDLFYDLFSNATMQDQKIYLADIFSEKTLEPALTLDEVIAKVNEKTPAKIEVVFKRPHDQKNIYLDLSSAVILFQGVPARAFWIKDITDSQTARIEAERIAEMKSSFLATMSHEIRTPMQSIYGLLEIISDEDISSEVQTMVATAKKSSSDLLEILDDILDVAKVDAGKMELDLFEVPVRTLSYGVLECMEVKTAKDVKLIAEIEKDVPILIKGDPTRLRQVMLNLIGNSIKFTEQGSVTLRVSQQVKHITLPKEGPKEAIGLRFEIIDTGIGMSKDVAAKLFQAFTQADNSTTRKFGGTGLGLSISQKLIHLMGGQIGVISEVGQGSTFWFEIPTVAIEGESTHNLPDLKGLAVLSVEDHPKGAKEIYNALKSMGADVESCGTFKEGLELMRRRPFDVAVIDQGLPDGLGIDLMREAVNLRPFMGLIMYTVRDDLGLQYTAKSLGAKYLSKPAGRLGLGEAVKAASRKAKNRAITGPQKLLIAEDTEAVQDILRRQLKKLGVEADFVSNGVAALEVLKRKEHGILFTDLHMPDMDGYQLVAAIRAEEEANNVDILEHFPVVVITADVQMTQRQTYLSYGFDECLLKPVSLGQFKQLLIRWGVMIDQDEKIDLSEQLESAEKPSTAAQKLPILDRGLIVQNMGALDADSLEMLKMFIAMTAPLLDDLEAAFASNNTHQLKELGHSIKGAARSACCMALGEAAADIQDSIEHNKAVTADMVAAVRAEYQTAEQEILAITL
jgi:signal transduction histidine kinase/CheY-like chemotaxis protein/HPt (histidine-containing phosphotransfer) domain-containing protein